MGLKGICAKCHRMVDVERMRRLGIKTFGGPWQPPIASLCNVCLDEFFLWLRGS